MLSAEEIKQIGQEVGALIENSVTPQFEELRSEITGIKTEIKDIKTEIEDIKSNMVTKDYLDEKLADLRGDLVVLMRKEDTKLKSLIDLLRSKTVITDDEAKRLITMEPFAQMM